MKKKMIPLIITAAVALVAVIFVCIAYTGVSLEKVMSVRGYEIRIPDNWTTDSKGNFYDKDGNKAGSFVLVDVLSENSPHTDDADSEISRDFLSDDVSKYEYVTDGNEVTLYYTKNLPNPEPYAAELLFFDEYVSKRLAQKIYDTFKIPQTGSNPPTKNISVPVDENSDVVVISEDGVLDIDLLSGFLKKLSSKEKNGVNIVKYELKDEKEVIKYWYYLESDNGTGYMYSYYQKEDGTYTYDNNPTVFTGMSKVISDEKNTTSYLLHSEGQEDVLLVEFPLDRYRDNAEELIEMKTDSADNEHVKKIMDTILTEDESEEVEINVSSGAASVKYSDNVKPDEKTAYSQAAVLFSLAGNIDSVTMEYSDGTKYNFNKNQVNSETASDISHVADSTESFIEYTNEIKDVHENSSNNGEVVYSGSIVISYNTMVTHPRTGERVAIGPYAEAKGYGGYLGKTISCVIRRSGSGYIATASCGGSVIASYPLGSESELNWAKGLIGAY